ncbi:MAG: metallophosphoesterase [Gammaproteobacteria bacterium]|nr:metallophosphoesterase [Pseudomonadales bacterium]MCP5348859.1 metallophosphoesterase [Pseudomonadales bacterium]
MTTTRILQISDLHFGPPFVPQVAEALLQTIPDLAPDAIVVSGDLTQRAKRHQFEEARAFFARLAPIPLLVIPGNHDVPLYRIYERLVNPHGLYREIICDDLNPVLEVGNVVLVGLDSTAPRRSISNGRIYKDQLQHVQKTLENVPADKVRIVVAHHHFAPGHDRVIDIGMPKTRRAIECFVDHRVEMILGGHLHRAYIGNSLDFFPGHHRDRGVVIVQCGTTTSSRGKGRERDENSFNLIETGPDTLTVIHYLYLESTGKFAALSKHIFPRHGHPFNTGAAGSGAVAS